MLATPFRMPLNLKWGEKFADIYLLSQLQPKMKLFGLNALELGLRTAMGRHLRVQELIREITSRYMVLDSVLLLIMKTRSSLHFSDIVRFQNIKKWRGQFR